MKAKEIDDLIFGMPREQRLVWMIDLVNNKLDEGDNKKLVKHILENYGDFYMSRALYLYKGSKPLSKVVCDGDCLLTLSEDNNLKFILKEEDKDYWEKDFDKFIFDLCGMFHTRQRKDTLKSFIEKQFTKWSFIKSNSDAEV